MILFLTFGSEDMAWDYNEEHFLRYVNLEYLGDNYEEIIKTGFDFPKIFISCIKHDYSVDNERKDTLLKEYYPNPQEENEYYLDQTFGFRKQYFKPDYSNNFFIL